MPDITTMLDDCDAERTARNGTLTAWEREFIESLRMQWDEGPGLTDRQIAILQEIWERL